MTAFDLAPADHSREARPAGGAPVVSAVVATRDRPALLRQAMASIRAQDYPGVIETIVVFDQSAPDHTLARDDAMRPVTVVANDRAPGLAGARNTGILAARGELVALCDDDDTWTPDKLRTQVSLLARHPDTDVVMGGCVIGYEGRHRERIFPNAWLTLEDLIRSRVQDAHPSTIVARRDAVVQRIGLVDEQIPGSYGEDHDWMIRAARCGDIAMVQQPLAEIRWHRSSFFADRWRTIIVALRYLLDKHPEFAGEPVGRANLLGRMAFAHAALGEGAAARRLALESLRCNRGDRRAWITLLVSTGVVSAESALRMAHHFGRGI